MRIDAFLGTQITDISREKIKKAIQNEQCYVDGLLVRNAGTRVKIGQNVALAIDTAPARILPEQGEVEVIFEDEHLIVCNKAPGLTVHPCPSCTENTLIQRLASHYPSLLSQEGLRPGIVHRLDKDTSGLMLVALTEGMRLALSESFAKREVHKEYLALVCGTIAESGEISQPVGRHPTAKVKMAVVPENRGGKSAKSAWQRLYAHENGLFSLVKVTIFTGRTHQIRVHMAELGHPLCGDVLYGGTTLPKHVYRLLNSACKRHMLHACHLSFQHPKSHEQCNFYSLPPQDFFHCAVRLAHNVQKIIVTGLAGSGKSALLQFFADAGIETISADAVVAELYAVDGLGHTFFYERYQTRFMEHKKAPLDRRALRLAMQEDTHLRKEVEYVIHSLVRQRLEQFWADCQNKGVDFAMAEIPLYLENGWHEREKSYIVGVNCPQDVRYARLQERRHWDVAQCQAIDKWQMPEQKKMAACSTCLDNCGSLGDLQLLAQGLMQEIQKNIEQKKKLFLENMHALCAK